MESNKTKITVKVSVNTDINKVWDYWTKPEHIKNWNLPRMSGAVQKLKTI